MANVKRGDLRRDISPCSMLLAQMFSSFISGVNVTQIIIGRQILRVTSVVVVTHVTG